MTALLEVQGLAAGYGPVRVLHDIDLSVQPGEIVAVLGANGAGKTTLLRTLSGMLPARAGTVGATVAGVSFLVELSFLGGRERLAGYDVQTLIAYDSE